MIPPQKEKSFGRHGDIDPDGGHAGLEPGLGGLERVLASRLRVASGVAHDEGTNK